MPWGDIKYSVPTAFFSLLLNCDDTSIDHLGRTIRSAQQQSLPFWELHLVSRSPVTRERLRLRIRGLKRLLVSSPQKLRLTGTHVAYLTAGDVLDDNVLYFMWKELQRNPELDAVYTDEDRMDESGRRFDPWLKPGWSPELLLSQNYVNRLCAVSLEKANQVGGVDMRYGSASDFDLLLRVSANGARVHRCSRVGCHVLDTRWRRAMDSTREAREAKILRRHLAGRGLAGKVTSGTAPHTRRVSLRVSGRPIVSIIIPFKDKPDLLKQCVESIFRHTRYPFYEIILVSNNSELKETAELVAQLKKRRRVRAYERNVPFNYSAINNWAARRAVGDYLLFLNNDVEARKPGWLEAMLEYAQLPEVGAVGAKLLFPNGTIQHAGVIVGMSGMASHVFSGQKDAYCYKRQASVVRNYLAVTGACLLVRQEKFWDAGGFDEEFTLCGGDVALCLSLVSLGYRSVYHPGAVLVHYEKSTRGTAIPAGDYTASFRWYQPYLKAGDPYYNPNLSLATKDCEFRLREEDFYCELERRYGAGVAVKGG